MNLRQKGSVARTGARTGAGTLTALSRGRRLSTRGLGRLSAGRFDGCEELLTNVRVRLGSPYHLTELHRVQAGLLDRLLGGLLVFLLDLLLARRVLHTPELGSVLLTQLLYLSERLTGPLYLLLRYVTTRTLLGESLRYLSPGLLDFARELVPESRIRLSGLQYLTERTPGDPLALDHLLRFTLKLLANLRHLCGVQVLRISVLLLVLLTQLLNGDERGRHRLHLFIAETGGRIRSSLILRQGKRREEQRSDEDNEGGASETCRSHQTGRRSV